MSTVSTSKVLIATMGALVSLGALAGCTGSDGGGPDNTNDTEEPTPAGGINGPARVDPDSGGAVTGEQDD